jgi:hypothetical protein
MLKIYVASSLDNVARTKYFITKLQNLGAEITYDWTNHGRVTSAQDLAGIAQLELFGVLDADLLFFIHPARNGSHVELGVMIASIMLLHPHKTIVMLEENEVEQKTFYYLPCMNKFTTEAQAFEFVTEKINEHTQ